MRNVIAIVVFAMAAFTFTATPAHADCNTDCAAKPAGPMKNACLAKCATTAKTEEPKPAKTDEGDVSPTGLKAVAEAANAQPEEEVVYTAEDKKLLELVGRMILKICVALVMLAIFEIITLILIILLQKRAFKIYNTLEFAIAQRPGYGEMKRFIQLFTELAELKSRLEYEKTSHDTQAISSHAAELRQGIGNVQAEKNKLLGVINDAESRVIGAKVDVPLKPDKLIIKFANQGDPEAKAVVDAYNSAMNIVRKAEALLADLKAKMTPLDQREEQLGQMLEEAMIEANNIREARKEMTNEIEAKQAEIESLTSSPPPLPLHRRR